MYLNKISGKLKFKQGGCKLLDDTEWVELIL